MCFSSTTNSYLLDSALCERMNLPQAQPHSSLHIARYQPHIRRLAGSGKIATKGTLNHVLNFNRICKSPPKQNTTQKHTNSFPRSHNFILRAFYRNCLDSTYTRSSNSQRSEDDARSDCVVIFKVFEMEVMFA
jgi:hypothetical protein